MKATGIGFPPPETLQSTWVAGAAVWSAAMRAAWLGGIAALRRDVEQQVRGMLFGD